MKKLVLFSVIALLPALSNAGALPSPGKLCYDNCTASGGSHEECLRECGYSTKANEKDIFNFFHETASCGQSAAASAAKGTMSSLK